MRNRLPLVFASLASLASLTACHTMQMKVSPELADDRMAVSHHGKGLAFGEFAAGSVDRSWISSLSTSFASREHTRAHQQYRFAFSREGALVDRVACETVYAETAHQFGTLRLERGRHGLGCTLSDGAGQAQGELLMTERENHRPSGTLTHGAVVLEVTPSMRGEGARWDTLDPVGYELRANGALVGAVQTINGGAVWIDRTAPDELRRSAAVAAATLLLYQRIDG